MADKLLNYCDEKAQNAMADKLLNLDFVCALIIGYQIDMLFLFVL